MKTHRGMRPHDISVLLKIAAKGDKKWFMKDLAYELKISGSEISESINRSVIARLISQDKKTLNKLSLLDFLQFGLQYVFPQRPGALTRGVPTSISAEPLKHQIMSDEIFVWPAPKGSIRGQSIEPLHPATSEACLEDGYFYELMSLADAIRIGRSRERNLAIKILKENLS